MAILGIVAEYDPFHNGHLHHIINAKKQAGAELTYVVLSPCLKQRGTLSLLSPHDRARCALEAGADAVFALPVLWAVRDAENYALGAVSLLASLGATHIAFGAETDNLPLLCRAADIMQSRAGTLEPVLRDRLSSGCGYPAALSAALSAVLPDARGLLDHPNNTLAVCYLRAIRRLSLPLVPVLVHRQGAYRALSVDPVSPSASALRNCLLRGSWAEASAALPSFSDRLIRRRFLEQRIPDPSVLDALLLSRLRSMPPEEYRCLPDLSEGMENALRDAAVSASGRRGLIDALTGRRYPSSRISRLCAHALLGTTREQLAGLPLPDGTLLLGLRKNAAMTARWKALPVPVFSSFTEWKKAAHPADLAAWSLWAQCCRLPDTLPFTEKTVSL